MERILGDIHGVLTLIVLIGITLLFIYPDVFEDWGKKDKSKDK